MLQRLCLVLCFAVTTAQAQNLDFEHNGAIVHRRAFVFPQCVGAKSNAPNWIHDGPCAFPDIGWIDQNRRFHPTTKLTAAKRHAINQQLAESGWGMP